MNGIENEQFFCFNIFHEENLKLTKDSLILPHSYSLDLKLCLNVISIVTRVSLFQRKRAIHWIQVKHDST